MGDETFPEYRLQSKNKLPNSYYRPSSISQSTHNGDNGGSNHSLDNLQERILKLAEFKTLVSKLYSPHDTKELQLLMANQLDDDFLEKQLTWLRNVDRARSG